MCNLHPFTQGTPDSGASALPQPPHQLDIKWVMATKERAEGPGCGCQGCGRERGLGSGESGVACGCGGGDPLRGGESGFGAVHGKLVSLERGVTVVLLPNCPPKRFSLLYPPIFIFYFYFFLKKVTSSVLQKHP